MKHILTYRIVREKYVQGAFEGRGSGLRGGRWNSAGRECVYMAGSESLSILEVLAHAEKEMAIDRYILFELPLLEKDVMTLKAEDLPSNWRANPARRETREIGDRWLEENRKLALALPSAVVPRETIYLLNPKHKGFRRVAGKAKPLVFEFDSRLI